MCEISLTSIFAVSRCQLFDDIPQRNFVMPVSNLGAVSPCTNMRHLNMCGVSLQVLNFNYSRFATLANVV